MWTIKERSSGHRAILHIKHKGDTVKVIGSVTLLLKKSFWRNEERVRRKTQRETGFVKLDVFVPGDLT